MLEPAQQLSAFEPAALDRASRVIRVIGHPMRLRLLELLETRERNVTELVLAVGVSQATVSQHLRILRAEGVVGDRRDGPRVYYTITEPKVSRILDCIRECDVSHLLANDPGLRVVPGTASRDQRRPKGQRPVPR
jgi:ArsR family transcriptional regulator